MGTTLQKNGLWADADFAPSGTHAPPSVVDGTIIQNTEIMAQKSLVYGYFVTSA